MNLIGKIIRLPLKILPKSTVVPFIYGDLKGNRWITGSSNHGYWLGFYETAVREEAKKHLGPGDTFFDLGAHVGYFSLLGSKLVGNEGKVFAFEPLPSNLKFLHKHLQMNKINNVKVYEAAVAHFEGSFTMQNQSRIGAKLSDEGDLEVKVISLKKELDNKALPIPKLIKMDIEGEEKHLLDDIRDYLTKYDIKILLSTHGKDTHKICLDLLGSLGYQFKPLDSNNIESCTELLASK